MEDELKSLNKLLEECLNSRNPLGQSCQKIEDLAMKFFSDNQDYQRHDEFFGKFTPAWIGRISEGKYKKAEDIWNLAIGIASKWENENKPSLVHKGTPYYWLGVTQIASDKIEDGFMSMHNALKEDERSHHNNTPVTPAYYFVTLNYQPQDQAFGAKVRESANYLDSKITQYRSSRGGTITLDDFRAKFLACAGLREAVFTFVYLLFKLEKISRTDRQLLENELSSLLCLGLLMNFCIIIEKTIEYKKNVPDALERYIGKIKHLISRTSLTLTDTEVHNASMDFHNFSQTLTDVLDGTYPSTSTKTPIEADLMISLGIRNQGAHQLTYQPLIHQRWEDISQRVLNVLFYTIEKIY